MSTIGTIQKREIVEEMRESYLDYAMSVIVSRALPDVRDGLKPVHRRILFTMHEMGLTHGAKFRKCAAIVGDCLGKFHPHGDTAVYDSLVRTAQDFSLRYPLVDGQGNFGSIDGDAAAAMRYCITGETLIVTNKGLCPIQDMSENESENGSISVLSRDHSSNKAVKWFDSGKHPTIKITTQKGYSIQGSYNHPILVWTKNLFTGMPEFKWKLISQLKIGDRAIIDRTPDLLWPEKNTSVTLYWPKKVRQRVQIKKLPRTVNEDFASLLGALIAEGAIKEKKIEFCNSDTNWIKDFERRWKKVFPDCRLHVFTRKESSFGKKPYQIIEIHSQYVIEFLKNIGLAPVQSAHKTIPRVIFQSPKPVVAAFLASYFEGDGSISSSSKMIELSCCSKSEQLISQLQIMLLRFGIESTKRLDRYKDIHKLYIRGLKNYRLFKEQINFLLPGKKKKLKEIINHVHKDYSATDFVPFLSEFVRSHINQDQNFLIKEFVVKHNFDRYAALNTGHQRVMEAIHPIMKSGLQRLLEQILLNNYLFDPVYKIEEGGVERVYSLKVDSLCHSFVGNGFVNHNTEARMTRVAEELLRDIEKDTVPFRDNYDGTRKEPVVLPAAVPNLLLNGTLGIAVGMATNIPTHNLSEVVDALLHVIDHPDVSVSDLMEFIKGPDFPTGGIIFDQKAIRETYNAGKGPILMRGKADIEEGNRGAYSIIITEIPYQVNKAELIETIARLVQEKKIEGIRDVRDESDKDGLRIAIDLKQDAQPQKILNNLYKHTDLEKNFHLNMLALVDGIQPQVLSLKTVLEEFLKHRFYVVTRRTQFDLARARERIHILEGLKKALDHIDRVIETIKKSEDRENAHKNLVKKFDLSDIQATAILEMRLQTLAGLERQKIEDELKEKRALAESLDALLRDPKKMQGLIKKELEEIKSRHGDERKTKLVKSSPKEFSEEDLVPEEEVVIMLTRGGYVKRIKPESYRIQKRGGKGLIGMEIKEEDVVEHLITCSTHASLLFFTGAGKVYQIPAYEIPEGTRISKGKSILNYLALSQNEQVTSVLAVSKEKGKILEESKYIVMLTKRGIIKKVEAEEFDAVRKNGLIAITLSGDDALRFARQTSGSNDLIVVTKNGQAIRFLEKDVRAMGRQAAGVHAIRLKKEDEVVGMDVVLSDKRQAASGKLLIVAENGFGKHTLLKEYKKQKRGGSGIKTAKITSKTGHVISGRVIGPEETELITISRKGQVIRTELGTIKTLNRATQGVRIMRLEQGDAVASVTTL